MDGAVRSASKRILDNAFHSLRAHGADNHFAAKFLAHSQRFFQRISIRFADLKREIALFNPCLIPINPQNRIFVRDLLHHDYDFHWLLALDFGLWSFFGLWSSVFGFLASTLWWLLLDQRPKSPVKTKGPRPKTQALFIVPFKQQRSVCPTKPKTVGEDVIND